MATSFSDERSREYPERTNDHGQADSKLYHLLLRVECTFLQFTKPGANTGRMVIGLYELLGNPTT
jgi:hypothetical protein